MIIDSPLRQKHLAAIARRLPAHVQRLSWSADQIANSAHEMIECSPQAICRC
jgi:hypothetical protein